SRLVIRPVMVSRGRRRHPRQRAVDGRVVLRKLRRGPVLVDVAEVEEAGGPRADDAPGNCLRDLAAVGPVADRPDSRLARVHGSDEDAAWEPDRGRRAAGRTPRRTDLETERESSPYHTDGHKADKASGRAESSDYLDIPVGALPKTRTGVAGVRTVAPFGGQSRAVAGDDINVHFGSADHEVRAAGDDRARPRASLRERPHWSSGRVPSPGGNRAS